MTEQEKQIEAVANDLCEIDKKFEAYCHKMMCVNCSLYYGKIDCQNYYIATELYNAGYRKETQGEWVDVKHLYTTSLGGKGTSPYRMCSVCKWEYPVVTVGQHLKKYKHCPNCGSKMRGE